MTYSLTGELDLPYAAAVAAVREALAAQGFGILTEIDLKATFKTKLDQDVPAQVILGACRPPLAFQATQAEPSVAALLPCNVVVRAIDDARCVVEAVDPDAMMSITQSPVLREVATDAKQRLIAALAALTGSEEG